jgi:hypothetical protein
MVGMQAMMMLVLMFVYQILPAIEIMICQEAFSTLAPGE